MYDYSPGVTVQAVYYIQLAPRCRTLKNKYWPCQGDEIRGQRWKYAKITMVLVFVVALVTVQQSVAWWILEYSLEYSDTRMLESIFEYLFEKMNFWIL